MTYNGIVLPRFDAETFGHKLCRDLRSDHAGETGAVAIYKGMLACSRDAELRAFALTHLQTEKRHLEIMQAWLPGSYRSRLLPLWYLSGWLLGAIAAIGGRQFAYITISAVENFVIDHYEAQLPDAPSDVQVLLRNLQQDEAHHQQDAEQRAQGATGKTFARLWSSVVGRGSALGVSLARVI